MLGNLGTKGLGEMQGDGLQRNETQILTGDFLVYESCLKYCF
jgi:hypothetical protein